MYAKQTDYSLKFIHGTLDILLNVTSGNLHCIAILMERESKQELATTKMIEEIKSHVEVCNLLMRLAELHLGKLEHDRYLSVDTIFQYHATIYKTRARISEVTNLVLGE